MLLSARPLLDVSDVNHFDFTTQAESVEGCSVDIYFQLIDASVGRYYNPRGRRYLPQGDTFAVEVTLRTIDTSTVVTRQATRPFLGDPSIWKLALTAEDGLVGTYGLSLKLTETTNAVDKVTNGWVDAAVSIAPKSPSI